MPYEDIQKIKQMLDEQREEQRAYYRQQEKGRFWRTGVMSLAAGLIGGTVTIFAEQIIGDTKDTLGLDFSLVEAEEGIRLASQEGRYIFAGGASLTPYNLLSNRLGEHLDEEDVIGYGWITRGGSRFNLEAVNSGSYPEALAITQADVYAQMRDNGDLEDTSIIMNTGISECAFMVGNFTTFSELTGASERAAWGDREPIVVGMPNTNSGSHVTADNITQYGLDEDGIEIRDGYVGTSALLDAYERGDIDVAIFVQYPAAIDGELRSGMKRVIQEQFNLIAMDTLSYNFSFRDLPYGYDLLQVTMPREIRSEAERAAQVAQDGDSADSTLGDLRTSRPMLCTQVLLAGQNINTITDIIGRGNALNLHGVIQQRIRPEDLQYPDMPDFDVLATSNNPIEITISDASPINGPRDTDFAYDWMRAIRPEEFAEQNQRIEYAWVEESSIPSQTL